MFKLDPLIERTKGETPNYQNEEPKDKVKPTSESNTIVSLKHSTQLASFLEQPDYSKEKPINDELMIDSEIQVIE